MRSAHADLLLSGLIEGAIALDGQDGKAGLSRKRMRVARKNASALAGMTHA